MQTSTAIEVMVRVLTPYVGEVMARSAAQAHCQKLGIARDAIDPGQLEALLGRLGSGLNIFLGREKSSSVVEQIRAALRGSGEAP
jgi:hypothetical protein